MLSVLTGPYQGDTDKLTAHIFPYQPDQFQLHGFDAIENDQHVIVTAHTGSGKTSVALYALMRQVKLGKRVIYCTPIKALSNQIYKDLKEKQPELDVGIQTGDIQINPDAQVMVMTTEIVRNSLFGGGSGNRSEGDLPSRLIKIDVAQIGCVVFDEVHWIKDPDRGHVWEESIIAMPAHVQMIMLSATIPEAEKFGQWVAQTKQHAVALIPTTHRVVPLTHYVLNHQRLVPIMDNVGHFKPSQLIQARQSLNFKPSSHLNSTVAWLDTQGLLPAFFFCFSRDKCEQYSRAITTTLVDVKTSRAIGHLFDQCIRRFGDRYANLEQAHQLRKLLVKGVGYHHSGLVHVLKEIVEIIFSRGLLKVLFVTETFAAGVNMPAKTVVFTSLQKYNGNGGFRWLKPEEYSQMAGRAGRRGLDKVGNVIYLPFHPSEQNLPELELKRVMTGQIQSIHSQFKIDYSLILKLMYSNNGAQGEGEGEGEGEGRPGRFNLVSFSNESMLNTQAQKFINQTKREREQTRHQIEQLREQCHQYFRSGSPAEQYWTALNTKTKRRRKGRGGALRPEQQILNSLPKDEREELLEQVQNRQSIPELERQLIRLEDELEFQVNYVHQTVRSILEFLADHEYITGLKSPEQEDFVYTRTQLTTKGLIAAGVNECNPILLTELVVGGYLNSLSTTQIMSVLAGFIEERETERPQSLDRAVELTLNEIKDLARIMARSEDNHGLLALNTDWEQSREVCDLAQVWTSPDTGLDAIYALKPDVYEGNFCRNMLKLRNLAETTIKAANIIGDDSLAKKLERYQQLIVRGMVTPDSLYV